MVVQYDNFMLVRHVFFQCHIYQPINLFLSNATSLLCVIVRSFLICIIQCDNPEDIVLITIQINIVIIFSGRLDNRVVNLLKQNLVDFSFAKMAIDFYSQHISIMVSSADKAGNCICQCIISRSKCFKILSCSAFVIFRARID